LKYYGGKFLIRDWIISHFPPHDNYVEPCGGTGIILASKRKSPLEVFNDLDSNVVNFFRCLRDKPDVLIDKIKHTPYSREEFESCKEESSDSIENARRFFIGCWFSISHSPFAKSRGFRTRTCSNGGFSDPPWDFKNTVQELEKVADRFSTVVIENRDSDYIIERYGDNKDALVYFDPPYLSNMRTHKNQYKHEVNEDYHIKAAELLKEIRGYVVISGYKSELYEDLYETEGWERFDRKHLGNSGAKRIESIWVSPKTLDKLDYQRRLF
jgi:DNA adenine methylase